MLLALFMSETMMAKPSPVSPKTDSMLANLLKGGVRGKRDLRELS
jgi:hypothetical protein